MRLLNVYTLRFKEFPARQRPEYCILSHRWGDEETSYKDFRKGIDVDRAGYRKILDFCAFVKARNDPELSETLTDWVWIDTCCIDKRSSAELSEAINSMFDWYSGARMCIVHLSDVLCGTSSPQFGQIFDQSSWFSRGWTLQELLAPAMVVFCNARWEIVGHKCWRWTWQCPHVNFYGPYQTEHISRSTSIPIAFLDKTKTLKQASVAQRMSWAARRETTREEDEAYCLLGIFGINMPLIYGEGRRAFLRLQEEIITRSTDQSILAWSASPSSDASRSTLLRQQASLGSPVLAPSPAHFNCSEYEDECCHLFTSLYAITNKGLEIRTSLSYVYGLDASQLLHLHINPSMEIFSLDTNYSRRRSNNGWLPFKIPLVRESAMRYRRAWFGLGTEMMINLLHTRRLPEELIYLHTSDDIVLSEQSRALQQAFNGLVRFDDIGD